MSISAEQADAAVRHLRRVDRKLRPVIDAVGPFTLRPHRRRFRMLARSIVAQQLSAAAARTISQRIELLVAPGVVTAESLARLSTRQLRQAGVSRQKIEFLRDLSRAVTSGEVRLGRMTRLDDERVIETLVQVKGIGRWTAQMFLIFALGRLDVLPDDDLGVRAAVGRIHGLGEMPTKAQLRELAGPWRPFASVGSWYCWRGSDLGLFRRANGNA